MKWLALPRFRAKKHAKISLLLTALGVIVLIEVSFLKQYNVCSTSRCYSDELQRLEDETENTSRTPLDAVWQPVAGTEFRFYVYSAFVESRTASAVRVIAVTKTLAPDPVVCRLYLPNKRTLMLKARVKTIRENWGLKYSATFVLCLLYGSGVTPQETVDASLSVLAATDTKKPSSNLLKVLDTEPKQGNEERLHVCVKPFHRSYSRSDWFVEWIEMNRLLGVKHFYMYNDSLSNSASCLVEYYKKQGIITMLPWRLPLVSKIDIRTEGQFAAFNDCLYRSMQNAGWLLLIDVDEIVFPRKEKTIPEMLKALCGSYRLFRAPSEFMFRNVFFYLLWSDDTEVNVPLMTARKTRRKEIPHASYSRSKYVVRPRDAVELGNHFVWEFVWEFAYGARSDGVAPDRALLHHYRNHCETDTNCLESPSIVDRTAHRWLDELLKRVTDVKKSWSTVCPVDDG